MCRLFYMDFNLKVVHEEDLEKYLNSLGILEGVKKGEFSCRHCGTEINLENFLCMYPIGDEIVICCDNPECYQKALTEAKEVLQSD